MLNKLIASGLVSVATVATVVVGHAIKSKKEKSKKSDNNEVESDEINFSETQETSNKQEKQFDIQSEDSSSFDADFDTYDDWYFDDESTKTTYKGKNPDIILSDLKEEMAECKEELSQAQENFEAAKHEKDSIYSNINSINSDISSVKSSLSHECNQHQFWIHCKNWTQADWCKDNIIRYKSNLNSLYDDLRAEYSRLNSAKSDLDYYYHQIQRLKEKKRQINEEYRERLNEIHS